jgi:tetratricopeptide (TPR) repeat protein
VADLAAVPGCERNLLQGVGVYQAMADEISTTQRQIQELARRAENGEPLGIPGSPPPDGLNWREEFDLMRLERMEAPALLTALGNPLQAEALLRSIDARGDAEAARRLGDLLKIRGDAGGAEAAHHRADERGSAEAAFCLGLAAYERGDTVRAASAYRRGMERGSHNAAFYLGLILMDRGDTDGARTAFEQASASEDSKQASEARAFLSRLQRAAPDDTVTAGGA